MTTTDIKTTGQALDALELEALDAAANAFIEGRRKGGDALVNIAITLQRARRVLNEEGESYLEAAQAFVTAARNHLEARRSNRHIVVATAERGEDVVVMVERWADVPALVDVWSRDLPCTVRRSKGREKITVDGGGHIWFSMAKGAAHRGLSVDVVYIAQGVRVDADIMGEAYACVAGRPHGRVLVEVAE